MAKSEVWKQKKKYVIDLCQRSQYFEKMGGHSATPLHQVEIKSNCIQDTSFRRPSETEYILSTGVDLTQSKDNYPGFIVDVRKRLLNFSKSTDSATNLAQSIGKLLFVTDQAEILKNMR